MNKNNSQTDYNSFLDKITSLFTEGWDAAVNSAGTKKINVLTKYMPLIFRRWYFSAVIEDSVLTPANLVVALNRLYGRPETDTPNLVLTTSRGKKNIPSFKVIEYSTKNHPVISDLRLFLESLAPAFELSTFKDKSRPAGFDGLSKSDGEYLDYLCAVAVSLNLVKKMRSIKSQVTRVSDTYKAFFENPNEIILTKIIEATTDVCIASLNQILNVGKQFKQKLIEYLRNPKSIDEIFSALFFASGIDIDSVFEDFGENLDLLNEMFGIEDEDIESGNITGGVPSESGWDGENAGDFADSDLMSYRADLMTGTFFLGVILDRYFLTPMSYYLRIIQPLYVIPYDLSEEIYNFRECLPQVDEPETMIYAPCTTFALTELGAELFGSVWRNTDGVMIPDDASVENMIITLRELINLSKLGLLPGRDIMNDTVILKIKTTLNKKYWQTAEVLKTETLYGLHMLICKTFSLNPNCDFSFFISPEENPFKEYSSKQKGKKQREPAKTRLADLDLSPGDLISYRIYNSDEPYDKTPEPAAKKKVGFEIELMKTGLSSSAGGYPKIVRKSKLVSDYE